MIDLMLCCNDHRNGEPSGLLVQLSLPDPELLSLESPSANRHLRCEIAVGRFRLGKDRWWFHAGSRRWVGNWCWDSVRVTADCAADVICFCLSKGYRPSVMAVRLRRALAVPTWDERVAAVRRFLDGEVQQA